MGAHRLVRLIVVVTKLLRQIWMHHESLPATHIFFNITLDMTPLSPHVHTL